MPGFIKNLIMRFQKAVIAVSAVILMCVSLAGCGNKEQISLKEENISRDEYEEGEDSDDGAGGSNGKADEGGAAAGAKKKEKVICVYVCGAVVNEGVYELPENSRVYEAIKKAGGLAPDAASSEINQAQILKDEDRLYVPSIEETKGGVSEGGQKSDGRVNINTASKEELMTIPGIGEAKADLIIKYRKENGFFSSVEDIMNISGIKEGMFNKIKDHIKV